MRSCMQNFTLFSREKEWNLKCFHSFRELKSEFSFPFTHFENEKWNENALRSRSRMKSEMKMPRDRDREVKCQQNSREFSRNETLAGYCKQCTCHKIVSFKNNFHWELIFDNQTAILGSYILWPLSTSENDQETFYDLATHVLDVYCVSVLVVETSSKTNPERVRASTSSPRLTCDYFKTL